MPNANAPLLATERTAESAATSYDVFISYSRTDIVFARALEAALKRYRPPHGLPVPRHGLRVFRDEADFTGVDYVEAIRLHVTSAARMVLLCSPAARASRYVEQEIRLFAASRGAGAIVPVLVSGLPNNEAKPEQEAEKAFPDALAELLAMPLAADYRGHDRVRPRVDRGGFEGPWHKLLADIYGLPRAEVEQREKRRRAQLRRAWATGAGSVMTSLAALAAWALVSRTEAIRQRELAFAGLLSAEARTLSGPEFAVAERQALLALEAHRILQENGGGTEEALDVLAAALGRLPRAVPLFPAQDAPPVLAFSGNGLTLFRAAGSTVEAWILGSMRRERTIVLPHPAAALASTIDGRLLVVTDARGAVTVHHMDQAEDAAPGTIFEANASCVAANPEGTLIAALRPAEGGRRAVEVRRISDAWLEARLLLPPGTGIPEEQPMGCPALALGLETALLLTYSMPEPQQGQVTLLWPWTPRSDTDGPVLADAGLPRQARRNGPPVPPSFQAWRNVVSAAFAPEARELILIQLAEERAERQAIPFSVPTTSGEADRHAIRLMVPYGSGGRRVEARVIAGGGSQLSPGNAYLASYGAVLHDFHRPRTGGLRIRSATDGGFLVAFGEMGRFTADGTGFLATGERFVRRWDIATRRETLRFHSDSPIARAIDAPGGRYLAIIGQDGAVRLLDTAHPLERARVFIGFGERAGGQAGLSDDAAVLRFGIGNRAPTAGAQLLHVTEGRMLARTRHRVHLALARGGMRAAGPFPGPGPFDALAFLSGPDEPQGLLDLERGGAPIWQEKGIRSATFSPDGRLAAFAHSDGRTIAVRAADGQVLWQTPASEAIRDHLFFSADGRRLGAGVRSSAMPQRPVPSVLVFDTTTGERIAELPPGTGGHLNADGTQLVLLRGSAHVVEVASGRTVVEIPADEAAGEFAGAALLSDGRILLLAGLAQSNFFVRVYVEYAAFLRDRSGERVLARVPPISASRAESQGAISEEGRAVVSEAQLSADGQKLAGNVLFSRRALQAISTDDLSAGAATDAVVWNLAGPAPREILRRTGMTVAALSRDGTTVLLQREGLLEAWSLDRSGLATVACERLTRELSQDEWQAWLGDRPYRTSCHSAVPQERR